MCWKRLYKIPPPKGDKNSPLKALIFDSYYDSYRGVIVSIRIMDGQVKKNDRIKMMATGKSFDVDEVGVFLNGLHKTEVLGPGDVGYLTASIKNIGDTAVGDTITFEKNSAKQPFPDIKRSTPWCIAGFIP